MRMDISFEAYLELPFLNSSKLNLFSGDKSLMQAKYLMDNDVDRECFKFGRAFHKYVEKGLIDDIVKSPYDSFRTKEARSWKEEQESLGKSVFKEKDYTDLLNMLESLYRQIGVVYGDKEIVYTSESGIERFKAMLDMVEEDNLMIRDWKTTIEVNPYKIFSKAYQFGYFLQAYHYMMVFAKNMECDIQEIDFEFIFVQKNAPYEVIPVRVGPDALDIGKKQWDRAYERYLKAKSENVWPSYYQENGVIELEAPEWAISEEDANINFEEEENVD